MIYGRESCIGQEEMRFVLVSTHIDQTIGYAKVSYNLIRQLATLAPAVKVFHFGFQRHPSRASIRKYPEGVLSYDAAANEDPKEEGFGFNKIHEYLEMVNPDVVMIYNDPITVYRFTEAMKHDRMKSPYKLWIYLDQVYEGIAPPLIENLQKHADRVYCFSAAWKDTLLKYGSFTDVRVIEHAVDPAIFHPIASDVRGSIRKNMTIPLNAVVFFNANRNSQRKRLDLTISGFVHALKDMPNAYLIIASNMTPQTGAFYDLQRIYIEELKRANLDLREYASRLLLLDTSLPNLIDDEGINQLYNISDVGVNTSDGEGYGLCQLEHLFVGAPQIVTDVGTYRSFLNDSNSVMVKATDRAYFAGNMPHGAWAPVFTSESIAAAYKQAYENLNTLKASRPTFKTWSQVCDEFLEDVLTLSGDQATIVSVQAK